MLFWNSKNKKILLSIFAILLGIGIFFSFPHQSLAPSKIETISSKGLTFLQPENFGLAVDQKQILAKSYIPPCSENFDYCLYFNGKDYEGTNFESAGIRIKIRSDFTDKNSCLQTQPEGYTNLIPIVHNGKTYSLSIFDSLGDAAMGHYSQGTLYRINSQKKCYELETRIGESQYLNYEKGTIQKFTDEDRQDIQQILFTILKDMSFNGTKIETWE